MAPVLPRQSHTVSFYPPIRGPPPVPMPGPQNVTTKTVLELFAGTFCIFVVAVLFWKLAKFFRRFTKDKVIGAGNTTSSRYTKTWYGWVPLQRRRTNRSIAQKCLAKVQQWRTWNSAKNEYCSVWWNSSQKEIATCKRDSMLTRRVLTHLSRQKARTADSLPSPDNCSSKFGMGSKAPAHSLTRRRFLSLNQSACLSRGNGLMLCISNHDLLIKRNYSLPCLSDLTVAFRTRPRGSETSWPTPSAIDLHEKSKALRTLQYSRKYQIWSARMEMNPSQWGRYGTRRFSVPPGTEKMSMPATATTKSNTSSRRRHARKGPGKKRYQEVTHLSNWEIMLIDGLDRKIGWLSDQLSPGRRPFHFPLLPNHWLNIRTWVVYDPASRAPIDAKRRLGDPRFNTNYLAPGSRPKRKYPEATRNPASTPRIDSWRAAVNRNRSASGLRDLVKVPEIYDGSAEDPPDGHIDPACWILRKPPQGFDPSARQNDTYYEGGAGWQERFGDWQTVRRGYRIRKAIYEGRANRTRVKEVAFGVTRYYSRANYRRQNQESRSNGVSLSTIPSSRQP
ncbi:hypothetical protein BDV28DRAFT_163798 [Aspergillus coremiiformis]|uniref:Uncharacterized protein n=1 Tax=Aspergillus coremiiformis TaxID=138285 RepID=A0A5N6ZCL6_9EURO|nr:hypothetical protein BDV28DRAFT_163798 [Aspergillus coremiiformis]